MSLLHGVGVVLSGRVAISRHGTAYGDCSPRLPEGLERCAQVARWHPNPRLVLPRLGFVHAVASTADVELIPGTSLRRTKQAGDGVLLTDRETSVGIANADCAVGVLVDEEAERAVVMHLGLACLYREDDGPTLLEQAVEALGGSRLAFWVGAGIGPCCHGYDAAQPEHRARAAMLAARFGDDVVAGVAQYGPRRGQQAYDHMLMAIRAAESLGVTTIESDRVCTSCVGLPDPDGPGFGYYFSNTRDTERSLSRNLVAVGLR